MLAKPPAGPDPNRQGHLITDLEIVKKDWLPSPAQLFKNVNMQTVPNASIFFHCGQSSGSFGSDDGCGTRTRFDFLKCRWRLSSG